MSVASDKAKLASANVGRGETMVRPLLGWHFPCSPTLFELPLAYFASRWKHPFELAQPFVDLWQPATFALPSPA